MTFNHLLRINCVSTRWLRMFHRLALAATLGLTLSKAVHAGPMGFKESVMVMGDFSSNWKESFVNYAFTARDAFGVEGIAMRSDNQLLSRDSVSATYTRLVSRWNMPHAQANVWFIGGLGQLQGNNGVSRRMFYSPGVQVDYETTRVYVAATGRLFRAPHINHDYVSVRAGFSFFEVDYEQTQPWLVLEARRMKGLSDKTEITPMLRLIANRYFVELGYSNMRQARVNFMYTF